MSYEKVVAEYSFILLSERKERERNWGKEVRQQVTKRGKREKKEIFLPSAW